MTVMYILFYNGLKQVRKQNNKRSLKYMSIFLSYLSDGYVKSGMHFSVNFFRGEVTGQKAST